MVKRPLIQIFDINTVEVFIHDLTNELKFPYIKMYHSALGGIENVSILLTISLDHPSI